VHTALLWCLRGWEPSVLGRGTEGPLSKRARNGISGIVEASLVLRVSLLLLVPVAVY